MKFGSVFNLNAQFCLFLVRIFSGGGSSGGKIKTTPFSVKLGNMGMNVQGHVDVLLAVPQYNTQSWIVLAIFLLIKW